MLLCQVAILYQFALNLYNDDGDFGMGRAVRDAMQNENARNIAVFVTRFYGGNHLGPKRFSAVKELVKTVLQSAT